MIHALGRTVQSRVPDFTGPKLGIKVTEKQVRHSWSGSLAPSASPQQLFCSACHAAALVD